MRNIPPLPELRYCRIPLQAQHRYEGDRFSYMEAGPDTAGVPTIVMLHGIGANAAYFRFQLAALSKHFRVVAWNAPGYSLSDVMITKSPTHKDYAQAVADFADSLSLDKFVLTGNSFGSAVAQAFAIHFPQRVRCMLLTGTGVGQIKISAERKQSFEQRLKDLQKGGYQYADHGIDRLVAANTPIEIKTLMTEVSRGLMKPGLERAVAFRLSNFFSPTYADKLSMPVLLVQGSEDKTNPKHENADLLKAALPQCVLEEWHGVGHLPEIEASERFNSTLKNFVYQHMLAPDGSETPSVWLNLSQAELDRAYNQSNYAANIQEVLARYASNSESYRLKHGKPQNFKYGPAAKENLDFYASNTPNAPTQIFIHGGAWRGGLAKNYGFIAKFFVDANINLIVADFDRVEDAEDGLNTMVNQVRRVVQWAYKQAHTLNIDRDQFHLFGHSSGAHLVACALTTDWQTHYNLPTKVIQSATCTSGIYDLKPVRKSSRNGYLNLTDEIEQTLSPERYAATIRTPLIIAFGTKESPEFIRQAKSFEATINAHRSAENKVTLLEIEGQNHFEVLENITQPNSELGRAILRQFSDSK
jgi:arylformamidase